MTSYFTKMSKVFNTMYMQSGLMHMNFFKNNSNPPFEQDLKFNTGFN